MVPKIFISRDTNLLKEKIASEIEILGLKLNHPDLLYINNEESLGVETTKRIVEFLVLKPFNAKNKGVILETADKLTPEAQNSLLKTLEELPDDVFFVIGALSEESFLPTIKSRCEIIFLELRDQNKNAKVKFLEEIEKLEEMSLPQKFVLIEKTEDKDLFLEELVLFYRQKLLVNPKYLNFSKKLLKAEEFKKHNVNIRGILEYLMLNLPIVNAP